MCRHVLILMLFLVFFYKGLAQDLALHKSYTLSVAPNYPKTASLTDRTSLTDGVYTNGAFWSQPTTVGWQNRNLITIRIDLGKIQPVGNVILNTAGGISNFYWPHHIYVFLGEDSTYYTYVGDAADVEDKHYGTYKVRKFSLNNIDLPARFISITVLPKVNYFFCDEIEVLKGKINYPSHKLVLTSSSNIGQAIDSINLSDFRRGYLMNNLSDMIRVFNREKISLPDFLLNTGKQLSKSHVSSANLSSARMNIGVAHALSLEKKGEHDFVINRYSPWNDSLSELYDPTRNINDLRYSFLIPRNYAQYASFVVTNCSQGLKTFSFDVAGDDNKAEVTLYNVPFVPSNGFKQVADPLITLPSKMTISGGYSAQILLKIIGNTIGADSLVVLVHEKQRVFKIKINYNIINLFANTRSFELNADNWAYLTYPMLKDRRKEAAIDLESHHINTVIVPSGMIPAVSDKNCLGLLAYLHNFTSIDNLLLYLAYPSNKASFFRGSFFTSAWKDSFAEWYGNLVNVIHRNGFPNVHIFLYPYDEVRGKDIIDFANLIRWAKKKLPGIRFYATLSNNKAIDSLLPLLDIAQIYCTDIPAVLPPHDCEIWMYCYGSPARNLSPYMFYRLIAWKAFLYGYTGIGFWNYADEGGNEPLHTVLEPMMFPDHSYSVIYDGSNKTIISTKRWEAFRLGIEDYQILYQYGKKYGMDKAKAFAEDVIDNMRNLGLADSARRVMTTKMR